MSAFHDWIADAKAIPIAIAVEPYMAGLRRQGRELVGPCPACGGTDRFSVNPGKGVFHCRGSGRGGDSIEMVEYLQGCDFLVACEILTGRPRPDGRAETEAERAARERDRAERRRLAETQAAEKARTEASFREAERARCWRTWDGASPIPGTPAEAYLGLRLLPAARSAPLRFAPDHALWSAPPPHGAIVHRGPAMLAAITRPDGRFGGLHATWIDLDAPDGKARLPDPKTGEFLPARKARGSVMGGRIELARCRDPEILYLGEGIETVLSVWDAVVTHRPAEIDRAAAWSSVSLGNLTGRARDRVPHPSDRIIDRDGRDRGPRRVPGAEPDAASAAIVLPDSVRDLVILGDGDSDTVTTGFALARAARRHASLSDGSPRRVRIAMAPPGQDFNDMLRSGSAGKRPLSTDTRPLVAAGRAA